MGKAHGMPDAIAIDTKKPGRCPVEALKGANGMPGAFDYFQCPEASEAP